MDPQPAPSSKTVCVLTSVHIPFDGRIFHRECRALAEAGYSVTLIAPMEHGSCPAPFERDGVTVLGVPRPGRRILRPLVWWQLYRQVRRMQPQVVHLHDPELLLLVPLLRIAPRRRIKIVYDVHEYFVDSLAGKHWIPARLRPAAMSLAEWLEGRLTQGLDGIICAVEEQTHLYSPFRGPISVVRNLPLVSMFEGAIPHPAMEVGGLRLLYAGVITPERGIGVIVEAMGLLQQRATGEAEHGVEDVTLFLCGPGSPPGYLQEIQALAKNNHVGDRIRWLGYVPQDQIKHYMANADVGMAPGLPTRQFIRPAISTKLFEYMLCALPIISADCSYHRLYVDQAQCGLIVPPEDAAAYAAAILQLRDHPEEARAMGERGRAMVLGQYTWEREQTKLLAFYEELTAPVEAGSSPLNPSTRGGTAKEGR